ncbi:MAG: hypothetical protein QOH41_3524 [Blastocatellia bacterium]|nr:hypothetical protein [Blastocatellia bacterium]
MSQHDAAIYQAVKFSKKCRECGLKNFADVTECRRCKAELSRRTAVAKSISETETPEVAVESGRSKTRSLLILAAALAIFSVISLFYLRQNPSETQEPLGEVSNAQSAATQPDQAALDPKREDAKSQQAAKQVLTGLKRFQVAIQPDMSFDEYHEMLIDLNADLNSTLPKFVSHNSTDESFRKEVTGALRDYTAAENWWKTSIKYRNAVNDADRLARQKTQWGSAQTHLDNAEKLLLH